MMRTAMPVGLCAALLFTAGMNHPAPKDSEGFGRVLISSGPSPQIPESAASVYDWLIGDWQVDVYDYRIDGSKRLSKGEWHFAWVLEGRAVQDVWIDPADAGRNAQTPVENNRYGSTLRIYDPKIDAWRVFWFNPVTQTRDELIGRRVGRDIVQQGTGENGSYVRWDFVNITPDSFVWRGETSTDGGTTWHLGAEFHARRLAAGNR